MAIVINQIFAEALWLEIDSERMNPILIRKGKFFRTYIIKQIIDRGIQRLL